MLRRLKIGDFEVILENFELGQGKITVSGYDFGGSTYWGAMSGETIEQFIQGTNEEYFANRLMGSNSNHVICPKKTMTNLRKYIREEIDELRGWYQHMEFQKHLRETLREWEIEIEDDRQFVDMIGHVMGELNFYLIDDEYDRREIEEKLKFISEPWYLIGQKDHPNYARMKWLHKELKKALKKGKGEIFEKVAVSA